jgi:hypothetical protein
MAVGWDLRIQVAQGNAAWVKVQTNEGPRLPSSCTTRARDRAHMLFKPRSRRSVVLNGTMHFLCGTESDGRQALDDALDRVWEEVGVDQVAAAGDVRQPLEGLQLQSSSSARTVLNT